MTTIEQLTDDTVIEGLVVVSGSESQINLCSCCALMVMNLDESECRYHHQHDHDSIHDAARTTVLNGPFAWESTAALSCEGHGGFITTGEHYWTAEHF